MRGSSEQITARERTSIVAPRRQNRGAHELVRSSAGRKLDARFRETCRWKASRAREAVGLGGLIVEGALAVGGRAGLPERTVAVTGGVSGHVDPSCTQPNRHVQGPTLTRAVPVRREETRGPQLVTRRQTVLPSGAGDAGNGHPASSWTALYHASYKRMVLGCREGRDGRRGASSELGS